MNPEVIVCEVCGSVVEKRNYERHLKYGHKEKRENKCELCQKLFTSVYNLQYHMAHHINARNFLCNECPRAYNTAADLAQHQRIHEKQREPYRCDECGQQFQIRSKFHTHLKTHKSPVKGPRECPICKKLFVSLSSHNRTVHLAIRTHECSECGKTFGKKSGLVRHTMTVHQGERPYKCEFQGCNGAFGEKSQLKKHTKIHENEESSFRGLRNHCTICFKKFSKKGTLKHHMKVVHSQGRNFFCDFCPNKKGFTNKLRLKRHLRIHRVEDEREDDSLSENEFPTVQAIPEEVFLSDPLVNKEDQPTIFDENHQDSLDVKSELFSDNEEPISRGIAVKIGLEEIQTDFSEETSDLNLQTFKQEVERTLGKSRNEHESGVGSSDLKVFSDYQNASSTSFTNKFPPENNEHSKCRKTEFDQDTNHERTSNKSQRSCDICKKTFTKERNLQMHIMAIHNEKSFGCEVCGKMFSFKQSRDRHVKVVHFNLRNHQCSFCQKFFGTKPDMRNHIAYFHCNDPQEQGKHYCSICDKSFISSRTLTRHHQGVHENIKQKCPRNYRCKYCKEILPNKYQKEKHIAQVHQDGLKPFRTCRLCNLDFEFFDQFKSHLESHGSSHFCLICGQDNEDGSTLFAHMENHRHIEMELRRFMCDFCGHKLFNKIQLKVHMRKHMKESHFYVCDVCGQSYKYIAPFLYHKKTHEGTKDFICTHCGKEFMRKPDLIIHIRSHTQEKPFKCSVCDKRFAAKQILYMHLQTHTSTRKVYNCKECKLTFVDKIQAKRHDEEIHPDRRPFWCQSCKQSFAHEHLLKIHMKHKHKPDEIHEVSSVASHQNESMLSLWS